MRNRTSFIILALITIFVMSSCHTTEKFVVYGQQGTEIYSPQMQQIGVIGFDGSAKIKLSSDDCASYLLAKNLESDLYIPFALDYKNKSYGSSRFLSGLEYVVAIGSVSAGLGIGLASGGDGAPLAAVALACIPTSLAGIATSQRLNQTTREWKFTYHKQQHTNNDLLFTEPQFNEPVKQRVFHTEQSEQDVSEIAGWTQEKSQSIKLPFKNKTYNVIQVVTHFNGRSLKMEPEGNVVVKDNTITIKIEGNSYLNNMVIGITKDLNKTLRFGDPLRNYCLYSSSDDEEVGLFYEEIDRSLGLIEQKILIKKDDSILFEIAFM